MKNRKIVSVLILAVLIISQISMVFADTTPISVNSTDIEELTKIITEVSGNQNTGGNAKIEVKAETKSPEGNSKLTLMESDGTQIYFSVDAFKNGNEKEVKKMMTKFIDGLKNSTIDSATQQNIMTEIQATDTEVAAFMIPLIFDNSKADLFTAYKWISPLLGALRTIFGIGAFIIILILVGSTILDLVYMGIPLWREAKAEKSGSNSRPWGISYEAYSVIKETESTMTSGEYRNVYLVYFKRRALTYVLLAICIMYLIAGQIGDLVAGLLNLTSGIF